MSRLCLLALGVVVLLAGSASAGHTPTPASVNLAGSLESEATGGACGDWDPGCAGAAFAAQPNGVYLFQSQTIPAGDWEYKIALGSWAENYGANFQQDGPNIGLHLAAARTVRFYYDHKTHYIADAVNDTVYTVPGNYGPAIGCPEWAPECLGSLMSDIDGDGVFTFVTTAIPPGSYEFKVATDECWCNPNYGQGGGGTNVQFTVSNPGSRVTVSFDAATHVPSVSIESVEPDNNVEWDGLRHDSRDLLYRSPGGAVPAGTPVLLRFRTFHDDVTGVKARIYDVNASAQRALAMTRVASDVSCYQPNLGSKTCDFWQATLPNAEPNNLWYRFVVTDGTKTVYYADDTQALDGGLGATSNDPIDNSYALTVYEPGFTTPTWPRDAVIYQIFPDRFRNGDRKNDPKTGDARYDDPVLALPWNTKPEGYCRSYSDAATSCPWRFDPTPPPWSPTVEGPRGRDYMGGDLEGVTEKLEYLERLGVNTIYFNPIFEAKSNHRYDTADYTRIDRYLGNRREWKKLVKEAHKRGMRIVLDGVFNHMSSDSPFFDRYHHYPQVGACESLDSPWRSWFVFRTLNIPCGSADYEGWFGFDSIPVLAKSNPAVQDYFIRGQESIAVRWLDGSAKDGADGWRLDVMGDPSFPNGYWETFRQTVKSVDPTATIIGELWQKDTTTLRFLRGDRADSTMNYRLRDAVLGLLAPQDFDAKGFGDSGRHLSPSEFVSRLSSVQEDYPRAAFYDLMNLLDSHDTARLLWQLTPGANTTAAKENAASLAAGKQRQRLASLIQFTLPGAPTVYYGDEVGVTGADDPDDRRTYPWTDTGGNPDTSLFLHYRALAGIRRDIPALRSGDLRMLLADDGDGVVAYGRKTSSQAALVALNTAAAPRTFDIPVAGYVPDGTTFAYRYGGLGTAAVAGGVLPVTVAPLSGVVLASAPRVDLLPPAAPTGLRVTSEGDGSVSLAWNAQLAAVSYDVYRSPVSGGGYVRVGSTSGTTFTDTGLRNATPYYYVVRAFDAAGNVSGDSNEVSALPHLTIGWSNLQWPPSLTHTISVVNRTGNVYGQVWIDGQTSKPGPTPSLSAQLGFGPDGSDPTGGAWTWVDASFNTDAGSNDEFVASMLPESVGRYDYAYRYTTTNGRAWVYADLDGSPNGYSSSQAGDLLVQSSGDTTAPAVPGNLRVTAGSVAAIELEWDAVTGDPTLYGYEVLRSETAGGPYTQLARLTGTTYADTSVVESHTYYYVVRAVDLSFNRSGNSNEVSRKAELRTVSVVWNVTVPATTDGTGRSVYIAGFLDRLDPPGPQWDPGGVVLSRVDATHWTITRTGKEGTQLEYKFTLGDWDHVEKDGSCGEIANRQLTLSYGANGIQNVADTVENWRTVAPCGS